mmetsp:Transcript_137818/g.239524  ORF Transcript_137818/g.239524 Transcript_137818/m.239524 type:complete len:109 (-) Transcript_137818:11-337(-)
MQQQKRAVTSPTIESMMLCRSACRRLMGCNCNVPYFFFVMTAYAKVQVLEMTKAAHRQAFVLDPATGPLIVDGATPSDDHGVHAITVEGRPICKNRDSNSLHKPSRCA